MSRDDVVAVRMVRKDWNTLMRMVIDYERNRQGELTATQELLDRMRAADAEVMPIEPAPGAPADETAADTPSDTEPATEPAA